jgi:hypothetical protein
MATDRKDITKIDNIEVVFLKNEDYEGIRIAMIEAYANIPEIVNNNLYNVGYLCKRDGGVERFEKLHVTPDEVKVWGMQGGRSIQSFNTDCG